MDNIKNKYKSIEDLQIGEIVYCDLIIIHKKKEYKIKNVIYKNDQSGLFNKKKYLDRLNIQNSAEIKSINILCRLGFESKTKGYTEVLKSQENRNKITGAYE
jgi:hypothetical protein